MESKLLKSHTQQKFYRQTGLRAPNGNMVKGEDGVNELFRMINGDKPMPEIMLNYQKLIAAVFNSRQEPIPIFPNEELERLTMPSLLIVGKKDMILNSLETAERYKRLVPNSNVVVLPDAGHALTGLSDEIIGFLIKQ